MNARNLPMLAGLLLSASVTWAVPDDPYATSSGAWTQDFADQWALEQQRIYADIAPRRKGEPTVVAVIDTGIDYTHEDLAREKLWTNPGEKKNGRDDDNNGYVDDLFGWNFVDQSNNPWDESGHGTHIAGVIAACTYNGVGIAAINNDAVIMPLKVANFAGQARSANVAAAIYYAVDHGASIINISLGGELITDLEREAAEYAMERDVLVVVSAGNRGLPTEKFGYAGLPGALVVGAMAPDGSRAGFSNFGDGLSLLAPGVDVLSLRAENTDFIALSDPLDYEEGTAVVGEEGRYYRASGTSFAAAVASGVASKLKSMRPELGARDLKALLEGTASDIAPAGVDQLSGNGGLDYIAALGGEPDAGTVVKLSQADLVLEDKQLWVDLSGQVMAETFSSAVLMLRPVAGSIPEPEEPETKGKSRRELERELKKREREARRKKKRGEKAEEDPYAWQTLMTFSEPQAPGVLTRLSIDDLTRRAHGSTAWELRLVLNGSRTAYLSMALPQPDVYEPEPDRE